MLLAIIVVLMLLAALLLTVLALYVSMRRKTGRMNAGKIILNGGRSVNKEIISANMGNGILREEQKDIATILNQERKAIDNRHQIELTDCRGAGVWQTVFSDEVYVGSGQEYGKCLLTIPESGISRIHCRIYCYEKEYVVEDYHSTNHTWLNGFLLERPSFLRTGDCLQLGNHRYRVKIL